MIPRRLAAAAVLAVVVLSGCAHAAPSDAARFDNQSGDAVACLVHQRYRPDSAHEGGPQATTSLVLTMLHYYVANGNKPYCDGRPPAALDRAWLGLYLRLGADPAHVSGHPAAHPAPAGAKP